MQNPMNAIRLHHTGGPEVLQLDEINRPTPGPREVLVRAHSIGVGLADQLVRNGRYPWMPELPTIPGIEMSGYIETIGEDVTGHKNGDAVIVTNVPTRSCYAEYVSVDADFVVPCRDDVDLAEAACLTNYRVAHRILHTAVRARKGETIVIVGAAGGLGSALMQLSKDADLETIAVVRSDSKASFARDQNADHVINTLTEDLAKRIMEITDDRGVDHFIDPVGGEKFVGYLDLLAPAGTLVLYGLSGGLPTDDVFAAQCKRGNHSPAVRMFSIHSYDENPEDTSKDLSMLIDMIAEERIKPVIFSKLSLGEAVLAHKQLEEGKVLGKIVLQPRLD